MERYRKAWGTARLHYQQLLLLARDADSERPALKMAREYLAKE
jgi:hypothetical protein